MSAPTERGGERAAGASTTCPAWWQEYNPTSELFFKRWLIMIPLRHGSIMYHVEQWIREELNATGSQDDGLVETAGTAG